MSVSAGSGARAASSQRDGRVSHRAALEDDPDHFDAAAERDRLARRLAEEEKAREAAAQQQKTASEEEEKSRVLAAGLAIDPASPSSQQRQQPVDVSSPSPSSPARPASALSPGSTQQASSLLNPWTHAPGSNVAADPYTRHLHETIRDLQTKVTSMQKEMQLKTESMAIQAESARRKADDQSRRLHLYKTLFAQMLVSQYVKTWRTKRTLFRIQDLVFNLLPYVLKEYERNPSKGSTFDSSDVGFDGAAAGSVGGAGAAAAARRKANESAEAVKLANAEHVRKEKARMEREHDAQIAAIYASAAAGGSAPTSPPATAASKRRLAVTVQEEAPSLQQQQTSAEPSPIDSGILQMSPTNARAAQQHSATSALTPPAAAAGPSSRRARAAAQAARERPRHLQLDVTPADVARMGRLRKVRRGARMLATPIVELTSYIEDVLLLLQQAIIALIARLPLAEAETERLAQRNVELKCELTDLAASQQNEKQELRETRAALAQLQKEHERLQRSFEIVRGEKELAVHHLVLHGGWNPGRETQFGSMSVAHLSRPTFYRPREKSQMRSASANRSRPASPAAAAGVGRAAASEQTAAAASSSSRAQSASRSRPRSAAPTDDPQPASEPAAAADDGSETDFLFQRDTSAVSATADEPSRSSRRSTAAAAIQPASSLASDAAEAPGSYSHEEKEADPSAQPQSQSQSRGRSSTRKDPRASSRSPLTGRLRSNPYQSTGAGKHSSASSRPRPHSAAYTSNHNGAAIAEERTTSPKRGRDRSASPTIAELVRSASARASLRELSPGRPSALFTSNKRFDSGDIGGTNMYLGVGSASFDRLTFATMEAQRGAYSNHASKTERDGGNNDGRDKTAAKRDRILEARREQLAAAQAALDRRERKRQQAQADEEAAQQQQYLQQQKARARRPSSSPSRHASYQEHIAASPLNVRPVTASKSRPSSSQKLARPLGAASSASAQRGPVVRRVLHFPSQQHEESAEDAEERAAQLQRSLGKPRRTALEAAGLAASDPVEEPDAEESYPDSEPVAATITIRDEEGGDDTDDELAAPAAAPAASAAVPRKTPTRSQLLQKSASAKRIADSPYKQQQSSGGTHSHSHSHKKHAGRHQQPTDVHMIDLTPISAEQRQQRQQQQQDRPSSAAARKVLSRAEELHVLASAAVATSPGSISVRAPPSSRTAEPPPPTDIAAILAGGHDYESYVREIEGTNNHEDAPHQRRSTKLVRSPASSQPRTANAERESQRRAQKAAELAARIEQAKQAQQQLARGRRAESKQSDQVRHSSPKRSPARNSKPLGSSKSDRAMRAVVRDLQEQDRSRTAQAGMSDEAYSAQLAAAAAEAYDRYQAALAAAQAARALAEATKKSSSSAVPAQKTQAGEPQAQPAASPSSPSQPLAIDSALQQSGTAAAPSPSRSSPSPHAHVTVPTAGGGFRFQLALNAPALSAENAYTADFVEDEAEADAEQPPASPILSSRSGAALRIVREEEDEDAQAGAVEEADETSPGSRATSAQRMARFKANMKKQ